jgi:hypothetical protein
MRRKAVIAGVVIAVTLVAAYVAGFWPEHRQRTILANELADAQMQLHIADARVRGAALLGLLLTVQDAVESRNYGLAKEYASRFFDAARAEQGTPVDMLREPINAIVGQRDEVTAAIATADPAVLQTLNEIERILRIGLGYPIPATA